MSIPHIIHYCWYGGKPLPPLMEAYINGWRTYAPGFEIRRWDESNTDLDAHPYMREAYDAGKYAFVSDVMRLMVLEKYGGIYLDVDVELLKDITPLCEYGGFACFEHGVPRIEGRAWQIATGLGIGAEPGHPVIRTLLHAYDGVHFRRPDGTLDMTGCPERQTAALLPLGLKRANRLQVLQGFAFLPMQYLCPMDFVTERVRITQNTYAFHHYAASWLPAGGRRTSWTRIKNILRCTLFGRGCMWLKKQLRRLRGQR